MDDLGQRILRVDGRNLKPRSGFSNDLAYRSTHDSQTAPWPLPVGSRQKAPYQPWYLANPAYRPEAMHQCEKALPIRDVSEVVAPPPPPPSASVSSSYIGECKPEAVLTVKREDGLLGSIGGAMGLLIMLLLIASVIISAIVLTQLSHIAGSIMSLFKMIPTKS